MPHSVPEFSEVELSSYLPTGWRLLEQSEKPTTGTSWRRRICDGAGVVRVVEVTAAQVASLGRLPALAAAFAEVKRRVLPPGFFG